MSDIPEGTTGAWQVRWRDRHGARKESFARREDAERRRAEVEPTAVTGAYVNYSEYDFLREIADAYTACHGDVEAVDRQLNLHLRPISEYITAAKERGFITEE
jgi:hypothetical protein